MSLLVKGVQVIDGNGREPYPADVLVQKGVISAIGDLKKRGANRVIDGLGHYIVPGFIDVHSDADHYLSIFEDPEQVQFLTQGVTTTFGGHCGSSLAPLIYGTLESVRKWGSTEDVNVNWNSMREFLDAIGKLNLGVNFGTLAGHSTIRRALIGDERTRLTVKEFNLLKSMLERAVSEGAFGISVGLEFIHGRGASDKEIDMLAEIAGNKDAVYSAHVESYMNGVSSAVKRAVAGGKAKTIISHLMPVRRYEGEYEETLRMIEEADSDVRFSVYPYETRAREMYTLLPEWVRKKNIETMLGHIRDKETRKLIKNEWGSDDYFAAILISGAPRRQHIVGKTIGEIAENSGVSAREAMLNVMEITGLRGNVFVSDISTDILPEFLFHKRAFAATHGNASTSGDFAIHERSRGAFPKYIKEAVSGKHMTITQVISKITLEPAEFFGIEKRGTIKEGNVADMVLLDRDDFSVKKTFVGGAIAGEDAPNGKVLRKI